MRIDFAHTCRFLIGAAAIAFAPISSAKADPWFGGSPVNQSWYPQGRASLSAGTTTAHVALPAAGQIANVCNTGAADAYVQTGDVTATATVAASYLVKNGTCKPLQLNPFGTRDTYLAGITNSGSAALAIETGIGTPPKDDAASGASGTVNAVQSGTWTVQPGNTANTTAWKVDGSGVTQPTTNLYQATASAAINISTNTTTQIIAISGSKAIYIDEIDLVASGTDSVTLEYGTGSSCGTGTTVLSGAYGLLTGSGLVKGSGIAPVLFVPAGNAFCILTTAIVQLSGSVAYAQF